LDNTYWYGKNVWAWDWTHQQTGSYPLDGVGMHIYVQQGSTDPNLISSAMQNNINAIWNTIISYEGWGTQKKIWVSEFGWQSSAVGQIVIHLKIGVKLGGFMILIIIQNNLIGHLEISLIIAKHLQEKRF